MLFRCFSQAVQITDVSEGPAVNLVNESHAGLRIMPIGSAGWRFQIDYTKSQVLAANGFSFALHIKLLHKSFIPPVKWIVKSAQKQGNKVYVNTYCSFASDDNTSKGVIYLVHTYLKINLTLQNVKRA